MLSKGSFLYSFVEMELTCVMGGSMGGMLNYFGAVLKGKKIVFCGV